MLNAVCLIIICFKILSFLCWKRGTLIASYHSLTTKGYATIISRECNINSWYLLTFLKVNINTLVKVQRVCNWMPLSCSTSASWYLLTFLKVNNNTLVKVQEYAIGYPCHTLHPSIQIAMEQLFNFVHFISVQSCLVLSCQKNESLKHTTIFISFLVERCNVMRWKMTKTKNPLKHDHIHFRWNDATDISNQFIYR